MTAKTHPCCDHASQIKALRADMDTLLRNFRRLVEGIDEKTGTGPPGAARPSGVGLTVISGGRAS
jgi:hypothetical protein